MYRFPFEDSVKARRPRRKSRKPRAPRWQPLPPPAISYFQSHDRAFFDANPDRTYFVRDVDDEEIRALLLAKHGRTSLGNSFAHWFCAPNEWPWTWQVACRIDRTHGVICYRYIASGCFDYTNYALSSFRLEPGIPRGELMSRLFLDAAIKSARDFPSITYRRDYRAPAQPIEGARA